MKATGGRPVTSAVVRIYTRKGDDGTTGLLYGGRVRKDDAVIEANGAVDEAQAALGVARAEAQAGSELDVLLVGLERDLWVLMAEVATAAPNRHKLVPGTSLVTKDMVTALESTLDALSARFEMPKEFVVPGSNRVSAALDVARTVVRRAERLLVAGHVEGPARTVDQHQANAQAVGDDGLQDGAAPGGQDGDPERVPGGVRMSVPGRTVGWGRGVVRSGVSRCAGDHGRTISAPQRAHVRAGRDPPGGAGNAGGTVLIH